MVASAIFKLALKAATPKSFSKMKSDYVPSPVVKETTDVLKALGKTEDDIVKFRQPKSKGGQKLEGSEKEVYKNPDLEEQAIALDEGLITLGEFKEARDILKPRKTYGTVPKLYENFDILGSLPGAKGKEYGIVGVNKNLKSGELVSSRFDIPAYRDYGRYVVTIRKGNELFGYAPTAILKNVKFTGNPNASKFSKIKDPGKKSFNIAKGGGKGPFAVMEGKWQNMSPESTHKYAEDLMDAGKVNKYGETGKEWTEIGFDPASKSSFYNRSTGEPIFAADKVVQVGPMLLARGIKKPTKEQLKSLEFTTKAGKKIKGYKEGGQVMPMQYGGGLSDAYSILSDRRRNQNMYGMGDAPMQQMPSQMSSVFQDPMEASAFSPVNMEQGGDIVVPTIYRQEGGSIPITSVNGLGIPRIVYREEGGGVDDSDSNYGGFGNFGDDFGDLGPGGSSDSFDDSGQDALNEYLGESNITDLGSVRTPQGFEGGDVPNSFNTYVVSPTTSDIRNQAFVDRNQIVRDYINTPYFSGQALANLNQAQQPTAEELDQEDKDLTYDFVNIKDEVDKASGEIGLKNYLGVNPNSRKEGDKAPAFNSVSLNPDGDSNTRALGDSINQAQGFEGRSLVDDGKEGLSTFLGESSLADAFGTPSNPTGPGEGFTESRNKDKLSNELANKSLRGDQRIVYMSVRNKNPNLTPDQVVELIDTIQKNSTIGKKEGGLIGIPKERMINNQPHQLSYINPQEAGLLKALGGSGRRVDGIPAYFSGEEGTDMDDDIGESFSGGDMSGSDDSGQDDLSTFLGESSLADAFGTPSDPIGPGEGFEAGPDDRESTLQSLASYMRSDPQGFMNRATDKKGNFRSQQVANFVQAAADRGNLQGVGIPFANAMEKAGLASFGKGMRSSLEAFTPGKALTRNDYDPEVLAGNVDLSENQNKVAIQAFGDGIRYSKSGDSIADVTAQMSALGFTEDQINNAAQAFGYSPNSTAQASQVYNSLNDARKDGAIQGLGLVGSILTSPISGFSSLGRGFYGQRDEKGNPIEKSVMDRVGDEVMQTDLGKSISGSISDTLGKDSKAGEIASTIGKGIGMINDPFGTILGQRGIRQTSVPNILEATPDNRYFSGPSSETPSGLEKGISSIVDFFGGPQAAYRNNIDVRQGEGQDEPVSRRPRINEPVESATASSSESNDGRLMNKFFAGLAATNVGKQSSGEGSIFRLIKSQNPQLTDDQIRAMIPNENNFA